MAYHPVPMLTINKLTATLNTLATYLEATVTTEKEAKSRMVVGATLCRETLSEVEPEIHAIKTGELLEVPRC